MAKDRKPRIVLPPSKSADSLTQASTPIPKPPPIRSEQELRLLAQRIVENSDLMERFRSVMGSNDKDRAGRVMHDIRGYAQSLDSSVTFSEATRLVLILMKMLSPATDQSDGK